VSECGPALFGSLLLESGEFLVYSLKLFLCLAVGVAYFVLYLSLVLEVGALVVVRIHVLPEQQWIFTEITKTVLFLCVNPGLSFPECDVLAERLLVEHSESNYSLKHSREL
jgi:hypothetical protein